jgi:hypothetical protein
MKSFIKIAAFCFAVLLAQSAFAAVGCRDGSCSVGDFSPVRSAALGAGRAGFRIVRRGAKVVLLPVRLARKAVARRIERRQNGELPRQRVARFIFRRR